MKIAVLAGGTSTERDVSLITGKMVYKALKENGHQVVLVDVFMGYPGEDYKTLFTSDIDFSEQIRGITEKDPDIEAIKKKRGGEGFFGPHVLDICHQADLVFMGLHGANGEDGKVQAALDLEGIRYTGTGPLGAAVSMDKALSKQLFREGGVPTPYGISLKKGQLLPQDVSYPAVVKACNGGSSVGVYMVNDRAECEKALAQAYAYDDAVIIEQYIKGREFSVGVIEGKALPIIEIAPKQGFYDYKNKYKAGSTKETCPANIPEDIASQMQFWAEKCCQAAGVTTYARVDELLDKNNNIFCLEINTLPGMTDTSLIPQEAAAVGISYDELTEKIIEISLAKYE